MSIRTGRDGYNAIQEFTERTEKELRDQGGVVFKRDTEPPPHEVEWVAAQLKGAESVLELGSGLGPWSQVAADVGVTRYVGIEPVLQRVKFSRQKYTRLSPGVEFIHGDARTARLGRKFDVVLTVTMIQHLPQDDAVKVLQTAAAHVKPNGKIVMLESRILDASEEECERRYADPSCAAHMPWKSLSVLKTAVPGFRWTWGDRSDRIVLVRE